MCDWGSEFGKEASRAVRTEPALPSLAAVASPPLLPAASRGTHSFAHAPASPVKPGDVPTHPRLPAAWHRSLSLGWLAFQSQEGRGRAPRLCVLGDQRLGSLLVTSVSFLHSPPSPHLVALPTQRLSFPGGDCVVFRPGPALSRQEGLRSGWTPGPVTECGGGAPLGNWGRKDPEASGVTWKSPCYPIRLSVTPLAFLLGCSHKWE